MPKYSAAVSKDPPRIAILDPSAFADDWKDKPQEKVAIGLRFISIEDVDVSRTTAVKRAVQWMSEGGKALDGKSFDETLNDQLIYMLVSRATTDCNDIRTPYFGIMAEDTIRSALTVQGARRLWDEIQILHAGSGPVIAEASDEELGRFAAILRRGEALAKADRKVSVECRKMVTYLLEQLGALDPEAVDEPEPDDEGDDGDVLYEARAEA